MKRRVQLRAICALILAVGMGAAILFSDLLRRPEQQVFAPAGRVETVLIIDPGHGGEDGGAVSVSGVPESGINLAIALKCDQLAGIFGVPVTLLRTDDTSLAGPDAVTLREKKRSDLQRRVQIVNDTPNAVLLSIHQNQFTNARYSGAQVFFRPEERSQLWAVETQELLRTQLAPDNDRQAKEIPEEIYLMSHIQCSAILVECGFLSNSEEDARLQTEDYQSRLAVVLLGSFLQNMQ